MAKPTLRIWHVAGVFQANQILERIVVWKPKIGFTANSSEPYYAIPFQCSFGTENLFWIAQSTKGSLKWSESGNSKIVIWSKAFLNFALKTDSLMLLFIRRSIQSAFFPHKSDNFVSPQNDLISGQIKITIFAKMFILSGGDKISSIAINTL